MQIKDNTPIVTYIVYHAPDFVKHFLIFYAFFRKFSIPFFFVFVNDVKMLQK